MYAFNTDKGYVKNIIGESVEFSEKKDEGMIFPNEIEKTRKRFIYDVLIEENGVKRYWKEDLEV